jgi:hypothetical protein
VPAISESLQVCYLGRYAIWHESQHAHGISMRRATPTSLTFLMRPLPTDCGGQLPGN